MLNQTNIGQNNNKFYVIQLLQSGGQYYLWTRWGRVGEAGQSSNKRCGTQEAAEREFCKKFKDKTKNSWEERENFTAVKGKYTLLEMDDEEGGEEVRRGGEGMRRGEGEWEGEEDVFVTLSSSSGAGGEIGCLGRHRCSTPCSAAVLSGPTYPEPHEAHL